MRVTSGDHPDGVFWTKSGQFGPSDDDHFRGQKAILSSILGLKKACLLMKWPFGSPQGVSECTKMGQSYLHWACWTIMWCLEPNLVPYKNCRGAKSAL